MEETGRPHFPVTHSTLDANALAVHVLSRYALPQPLGCRLFRRSMSDAYLVETPDGAYFFKVYLRGRHTRDAIAAEVAFLCDLVRKGVSVAAPLPRRDGQYLSELDAPEGTRYGVLYRAVGGAEPQETDLAHSRQFGRLAARIHACADGLNKVYSRWHLDETTLIRDPIRTMRPYLEHRPGDLGYLSRLGEDLIAELCALLPRDAPAYGICHGDLHTGNARFDGQGRLVLYDFDSFGYGWRALDIGVYRVSYDWMDLSREGKAAKARFWAAFIEGYGEVRALSAGERAAVELAMPVRHLELMGLTMRYWAEHQGIHWVTEDYWDQHIAWFKRWADEYRGY